MKLLPHRREATAAPHAPPPGAKPGTGRSTSASARPPRLALRFAVSTAGTLALAAAGILLLVRHYDTVQAERAVAFHARFVADFALRDRLRPADFTAPVSASRRSELDRIFHGEVLVGGALRARLYGLDGRVTYATDHGAIGKRTRFASRVGSAIAGRPARDVSDTTVQGLGSAKVKLLTMDVPVHLGSGKTIGVFEVSQDYEPIAQTARNAFLPVAGVLELVLVVLWLSLFPLLRRTTQRLRRHAAEMEHLARHDDLTGLPNRMYFGEAVARALAGRRRGAPGGSVMLIDLDRFKEINDTLGHQSGDVLLSELAARLRTVVGPRDVVARLGGDEFAVLAPELEARGALELAHRVRTTLERPYAVAGLSLAVEASIGISCFPEHGEDVDELVRRADVAMYESKRAHVPTLYNPDDDHHSSAHLELVSELRRALEGAGDGEIMVHYQPRVDLAGGAVRSVEALVRWAHPERGHLLPAAFIPIAEQTGLMRPLTRAVLREALRQARAWEEEGLELSVAVNLSERDLLDARLPDDVAEALAEAGLDPGRLELEISENAITTDPERIEMVLGRLHALGVRLSIDDFGTGYSSLSHLKRLPVDVLKIDKSFVLDMVDDPNDAVIVRSTVDLGHNLGLEVVAEGVASREIRDRLVAMGCDTAQGHHLGVPAAAEALTPLLAALHAGEAEGARPAPPASSGLRLVG